MTDSFAQRANPAPGQRGRRGAAEERRGERVAEEAVERGSEPAALQASGIERQLAGRHPRLVVTPETVEAVRRRAQTPEGRAMLDRLRQLLAEEPTAINIGFHAAGHGVLYLVENNPAHAQRAREGVERAMTDALRHPTKEGPQALWRGNYKMIIRTDPAVGVAFAYDLCYTAWDPAFRERVAGELDAKAREFIRGGGQGWNGSPASNWHANTRSAAGLCALAVLGDPGARQAAESLRQAVAGLRNYFATQSGDRGWTQEGFNYFRYPMTHHVLPFLQAYPTVMKDNPFADGPARWLTLFLVQILIPDPPFGHVPIVSGHPLWERNHYRSGDFAMGIGSTPPERRPAVHWLWDRWYGLQGDRTFDITLPHHALFALANWPTTPPENPERHLDRVWQDRKKGLFIFRNRWQDANDIVTVVDINANPVPGTGMPDGAGSFRLFGLGGRWATIGYGRGRELENVVMTDRMNSKGRGRLVEVTAEKDGSGSLVFDLSDVYGAPARRAVLVDYSGRSGSEAVMVVADRLSSDGTWVMHTFEEAQVEGGTFTLRAANGAVAKGTLLTPAAGVWEVARGQGRYSGADGQGEETPWINRLQSPRAREFVVVLTVDRRATPPAQLDAAGQVRVGSATYRLPDMTPR